MSNIYFTNRNITFGTKKLNEFLIVKNLLNEIKKSEQIRLKAFCHNDIYSEDFFNIINKVIAFISQLSNALKKMHNYDNLYKQNKTNISNDIRKFFDKIFSTTKKLKYIFLQYNIENQNNFSLLSLDKKINKVNKRNIEIITNINSQSTYKNKFKNKRSNSTTSIFNYEKENKLKNTKIKLSSKSKISTLNHTESTKTLNERKSKNKNLMSYKELPKKEINNSLNKTGENSTNKSSISQSKVLSKKNKNLKETTKKKIYSEKNNISKIENKEKEINFQTLNLNYLNLIIGKKSEIKQKLETENPIITKIKLIDSGIKPSIYTNYLLNKYKSIIDDYNEIEEKNYKSYSPNSIRYQSHSNYGKNVKRSMSDSECEI